MGGITPVVYGSTADLGSWNLSSGVRLYKDTSIGTRVYSGLVKLTDGALFKVCETTGTTNLNIGRQNSGNGCNGIWAATSWDNFPNDTDPYNNIKYSGGAAWYQVQLCYKVRGGTSRDDANDIEVSGQKVFLRIYKV